MQQLASHGLFNVMVEAEGDTWIDDHHTNEDIGMTCSKYLRNHCAACYLTSLFPHSE